MLWNRLFTMTKPYDIKKVNATQENLICMNISSRKRHLPWSS
jgi:hypothetical protein